MSPESVLGRIRAAGRRWQPGILVAYLGLLGLGLVVVGIRPLRVAALRALERPVGTWDNRWTRRVEEGERLVREGRYEDAVVYLARLDSVFPARHVKHARDRERERVLSALGTSYQALDRKRLTLATLHRLVAFDGKNYRNYQQLALAALAFNEPDLAYETLSRLLAIHPSHLPSLREVARLHYEAGRFDSVIGVWERYRTARRWFDVPVTADGRALALRLPIDGRWHDVWVPSDLPDSWSGRLTLDPGGWSVEVSAVEVVFAVGGDDEGSASTTHGMMETNLDTATLRLPDPGTSLELVASPARRPVGALRFRARLRQPMDPEWWTMLEVSFRNVLDLRTFAAAREGIYLTDRPPELTR